MHQDYGMHPNSTHLTNIIKQLQKAFFDYVNYPQQALTTSQQEMIKLRKDGGAKLIDIKNKAHASNIQWLMEITTSTQLTTHLALLTTLLGIQKGGLQGTDLFFITKEYHKSDLKITSSFYKEAIKTMTSLQVKKKIETLEEEESLLQPYIH